MHRSENCWDQNQPVFGYQEKVNIV